MGLDFIVDVDDVEPKLGVSGLSLASAPPSEVSDFIFLRGGSILEPKSFKTPSSVKIKRDS